MIRKIVFILLALFGLYHWRRWLSRRQRPTQSSNKRQAKVETVRCCTRCGVYLPESEGVWQQQRFYCCPAHRDGHV